MVEAVAPDEGARRRRKLWELQGGVQCSIVGTCFSTEDLSRLARKFGYRIDANARDYDLHSFFVKQSVQSDRLSHAMQKSLENRYAGIVRRVGRCRTEAELSALWAAEFEAGRVAGAYWAFLTHNHVPQALSSRIFGEVHMLSHVLGRVARTSLSTESHLLARVEELEARLSRQAHRVAELVRERDQAVSRLGQVSAACPRPSSTSGDWTRGFAGRGPDTTRRRDLKRQRATIVARERARAAEARVLELEAQNRRLLDSIRNSPPAAKQDCPGAVACDGIVKASIARRLLYIGGRSGGIEHLRRVAADVGAELLHHDGGEHEAIGRIDGFVERCDAVFCPIDCISHSACLRAKALCQRLGKPFVPLRTSGTTSFQRALSTLTGS
jgi:hypothetical protein